MADASAFIENQSKRRSFPLTMSSTLVTLLMLLLTSIQTAAATQIQGFIFWDVNSNGLLDTPPNNNEGTTTNNGSSSSGELSNGIVDAKVQLRRCTPFPPSSSGEQHSESAYQDDKSTISTTISTWHPFNMGQKFEGHNEIYPNGGYYSLDVTGDDNDGSSSSGGRSDCLLTDADLAHLENGGQGASGSASNTNERYIGCYLVISSPTNYQITSSFPLRHSNFHERFASSSAPNADAPSEKYTVEDNDNSLFDWVPYYDVINTTSYSISTSTSIINHGYHARTSECFGYHSGKRTWYKYTQVESSTTSSSSTTTSSSSSSSTTTTPTTKSTKLISLTTPNANQYNYNSIIYGNQQPNYDVYDTTLSMTPLGMSESIWPLDLRVSTDVSVVDTTAANKEEGTRSSNNGGLIMGLTLDTDHNSGEYVLLSDSDTLSEKGRGDGGGEGSSNGGGEARFEFVPMGSSSTSNGAVSALDYYLEKREDEIEKEIMMKEVEDGGVESGGAITVSIDSGSDTEYEHDNINGILENPQIMIDVIQSFLMERENLITLQGGLLELTGLTVVLLNQWSLVTVVDKSSPQSEQLQGGEKAETTSSTRVLATVMGRSASGVGASKTFLRGASSSSSSSYGRVVDSSSSPNHLLRGRHEPHPVSTSNRRMIALRNPHLVYQFAIYAKYREKDGPDQDEIARQLSTNFGTLVTKMCNIRREDLIARIRGRSGYFQGCNPKSTTNNNKGSGGDGTVTYTAFFGSSEKDYVEIDIGVVNRFDCDKLLPLYYYELESLAVRTITDDSGGSLSGQDNVLSTALQLLQVDDGHYTVKEAPNTGNEATTTIVIAVSVVVGVLFVAAVGAVWYVRKERRKLRLERERRRRARDLKFAARQARKERRQRRSIRKEERRRKEETHDEEELIPAKADVDEDADSLDDDEKEKIAEKEEEETNSSSGIVADDYELKDKDEVKDAPDDQSDVDSELERLFEVSDSDLQPVDEEEVQPVMKSRRRSKKIAGSESETDSKMTDHSASLERLFNKSERSGSDIHPHDQSNSSLRKHQRRKKKADGGSESGSKTSRDEHESTDKTPPTRSHSSQQGSNPASAKAEADNDSDPPTRIDLSERGKLQKGISDISIGLAASLKKSFTKVAGTLNDLQENEKDSGKEDDHKTRRRRKKRVTKSSNDESAEPSHRDKKEEGKRRRRRTLTKVMSSFRGSSNAIDVDDEEVEGGKKAGEEGTQRRRSRRSGMGTVVSSFRRASADGSTGTPRKRMTKTMSSMRMSVRNVLIGELSSSDDDSSSDSSSDSDSSSSSSNDSAVVRRKRTATRPVTRKKTSKESKSKKNTTQEIGTRVHKKSSKKSHDQQQATTGQNKDLFNKSELETSKDDDGSCAAVAMPKPQRKDDDESCAAVAMPKPRPEKSLGRGTTSNKSDGDNSTCAAVAVQRPLSERSTKSNTDAHRTDSKKRSKTVSKDGEKKKKDKSSHHHTSSSKKSHRKKPHSDKDETERTPKRRTSRRELVENLRSSLKTSLSSPRMGSLKGKHMSDLAQAALEDEGDQEIPTTDSSKRKPKHSSKKKSSHKHHHHHRLDGSERSDRSTSERNGEKPKRKKESRRHSGHDTSASERGSDLESNRGLRKGSTHHKSSRRHSDHDTSERGSDRESNRGSRKGNTHHKSSSYHRDKTTSSSSKHRERKRRDVT